MRHALLLAFGLASGLLVGFTPNHVAAQETPGPDGVPVAPSEIQFDLGQGRFSWTDNSTNESGFGVTLSTRDEAGNELYREDHVTDANVAFVQARSATDVNRGDLLVISVIAFNAAGESAPATMALALEGGLIPPTPTPPAAALPPTGMEQRRDESRLRLVALSLVALLALVRGVGLATRNYRR